MNVTSQLLPGPPADSLNIIMNNTLHYTHMQNLIIKKKKKSFSIFFSLRDIFFFICIGCTNVVDISLNIFEFNLIEISF
jgi:hypothetical protein